MLNPDFLDMLSAFTDARVEYLLVGAYALSAHGVPRATGDMDLWIRPTPDNSRKTLQALEAFGAPLEEITQSDLTAEGTVLQIGVAPRRIDILTSLDALTFPDAWSSRMIIRIEGIEVPVIGREDFIKNKRAMGRPKDLADISYLEGND